MVDINEKLLNIETLQTKLGGDLVINNGIKTHRFSNSHGQGAIKFVHFEEGLMGINLTLNLTEDLKFSIESLEVDAINFIFNYEGRCFHSFNNSNKVKEIKEFCPAVIQSSSDTKCIMHVKANIETTINIISLDKMAYLKSQDHFTATPKFEFMTLLVDLNFEDNHIHSSATSHKIGEYVKCITKLHESNPISELLHFKGFCYFILANHFNNMADDLKKTKSVSSLSGTEVKSIMVINDLIIKNPQNQYTIDMLCSHSGLSPAKLQEGFKTLNNRTVSDHIRHIRVEKAVELMKTTDLNISEIVYSIGFTSRSYFCKIFKAKYSCSPKQYKKQLEQQMIRL